MRPQVLQSHLDTGFLILSNANKAWAVGSITATHAARRNHIAQFGAMSDALNPYHWAASGHPTTIDGAAHQLRHRILYVPQPIPLHHPEQSSNKQRDEPRHEVQKP